MEVHLRSADQFPAFSGSVAQSSLSFTSSAFPVGCTVFSNAESHAPDTAWAVASDAPSGRSCERVEVFDIELCLERLGSWTVATASAFSSMAKRQENEEEVGSEALEGRTFESFYVALVEIPVHARPK